VGWTLGVIAVTHVLLTPLLYADSVDSILQAGGWNSIDCDPTVSDLRSAGFWYATTGLGLLWSAVLVGRVEKATGRPPTAAMWGLLGLAAWGMMFTPVSGFVVLLGTAGLAAYRRWRTPS